MLFEEQRTRRPCEGTETPGKHSRKHAAIKQRCHAYPQNTPCRWSRLPRAFRSNRALYDGCKLCGWSKPWRLAEVLPSLPRTIAGVRGGRMFLVPLSYDQMMFAAPKFGAVGKKKWEQKKTTSAETHDLAT